jgi:hypothetical protein
MSYTRPSAAAADFAFTGTAYTRPAASAADFSFESGVVGNAAVTLDISAAATGSHGVSGVGAVTLDISAAAEGEFQSIEISGEGAVTLDLIAAATGSHGVSGHGAVTLALGAEAAAAHGVAGASEASLTFTASGSGAHGVAGVGVATLTLSAAAVAVHERYEVRGEVRLSGVLVNRRVRAHRRDNGALVGEADTVAGRFSIHTGFTDAQHYIVPIDLGESATDWLPPVANRVAAVLAQDV